MGIVSCETSGNRAPSVARFPAARRLVEALAARFWPLYRPAACANCADTGTAAGLHCGCTATDDDAAAARRFIRKLPATYLRSPELAAAVEHIEALLALAERQRADLAAASLAQVVAHSNNGAGRTQ
jgi:hypothetical protein